MACFPIIAAIGYLLPICFVQPPQIQTTPPAKPENSVPLAQLPWSNSQAIVVTDDLKKALDALGASSVVISAERYREMMNQLKQLSGTSEKRSTDIVFSRCHISGEVKNQNGREIVELRFDLECRTQSPNTEVPIPLKGLRLTSASVNNNTPVFGPDPEHPSLIMSEPQVAKIRLGATGNLNRNGNECRLMVPRIPSAAITSLDLTVPDEVQEASIRGYGGVNVAKKGTSSNLQADALGVLSSFDLSWRLSVPPSANATATIESETKITLDEMSALVEVKMTPAPFNRIHLPWILRLPASATQIQAELVRPLSTISEPLTVKKNSDGTVLLSSGYSTGWSGATHVYVRYKQALPSQISKEKAILGMCDVLTPIDRQNGALTVTLPEEAVVLLRPVNLMQVESQPDRDGKRTLGYQFSGPGAGLEAVPLPRSLIRGAVEVKLQHTLAVREGAWILLTDLDVIRSSRASPLTLDFFWPEWPVNRKVLFSPIVRDFDQDQANQRLRIRLEGKQTGSFALHLESTPDTSADTISLKLPFLTGAQNSQENPMEVILQQERFRLEPYNWNVNILGDFKGLEEAKGQSSEFRIERRIDPVDDSKGAEFSIVSHPALLSVTKEPRLPDIQSRADVCFDLKLLQISQSFRIKFDGPLPKHFPILCPTSLKQIQFVAAESDRTMASVMTLPSTTSIPLKATKMARPGNELWDRYLLEIPEAARNIFEFTVLATFEHDLGTVTIPLIRVGDNYRLSANNLSVHCLADRRVSFLKLPADLPGWKIISKSDSGTEPLTKELVLQSTVPERLLAVQLEGDRSDYQARIPACHTHRASIETRSAGNGAMACRGIWQLRDITSTQLTLNVEEPLQNVMVDRCLANGQPAPTTVSWNHDQGCTQVSISLQPQNLLQPVEVALDLTLVRLGSLHSWWTTIPRICFGVPGESTEVYRQLWRIHTRRPAWLLYANQPLNDSWERPFFSPREADTDESYQFQTIGESTPLFLSIVPRSVTILICSFFSFLVVRFSMACRAKSQLSKNDLQENEKGMAKKFRDSLPFSPNLVLLLVFGAGLFFSLPITALALFWGAFPGILAGVLWFLLEFFLRNQRRKQSVFLSAGFVPAQNSDRVPAIRPVSSAEFRIRSAE